MDIIDYFTPKFMLGMTATPETDNQEILSIYDKNIIMKVTEKYLSY
jgi:superfamily II DNA or RNA helicase